VTRLVLKRGKFSRPPGQWQTKTMTCSGMAKSSAASMTMRQPARRPTCDGFGHRDRAGDAGRDSSPNSSGSRSRSSGEMCFRDKPPRITLGIGDVVSISIFEAEPGGS
jgi:hypothetical protein